MEEPGIYRAAQIVTFEDAFWGYFGPSIIGVLEGPPPPFLLGDRRQAPRHPRNSSTGCPAILPGYYYCRHNNDDGAADGRHIRRGGPVYARPTRRAC